MPRFDEPFWVTWFGGTVKCSYVGFNGNVHYIDCLSVSRWLFANKAKWKITFQIIPHGVVIIKWIRPVVRRPNREQAWTLNNSSAMLISIIVAWLWRFPVRKTPEHATISYPYPSTFLDSITHSSKPIHPRSEMCF